MPTNDRDHRFFDTADFIAMRDAVVALVNAIIPHYRLVWGGHPAITPIIHDIFKNVILTTMNMSLFISLNTLLVRCQKRISSLII